MHFYLIGYRGSGKSTVGRLVAAQLGRAAIDTDDLIEQSSAMSIKQIFEAEGEAGFRDRESAVIQAVAADTSHPAVVSLGGGSVLREANQRALRASGECVWLSASAQHLFQRIHSDQASQSRRPNLSQIGGFAEVEDLLLKRTPIYQQLAAKTIVVEGKTPDEICDEIVDWVSSASAGRK